MMFITLPRLVKMLMGGIGKGSVTFLEVFFGFFADVPRQIRHRPSIRSRPTIKPGYHNVLHQKDDSYDEKDEK